MAERAGKRILVVDDEVDILSMIKLRLKASGFEVITAENGTDGLRLAKELHPDLIVLDIMLPGIDGYQVCRLLKFDHNYKDIPIVMLTARSQEEDRLWGKKTGADYYLTKPFEFNDLLNKVNELLKK
jgi:DNA-binding response OmpR family regulator